jgi:hypothetical protein
LKILAGLLVILFSVNGALAHVSANQALYVGGTTDLKQGTKAVLDASDEKAVKFDHWQVPYERITALDYGQHVGRHWAYAALGVYGVLPILLTKKRHHYLSVEYSDDAGKTQAAIFEVGKDSIRTVLKTLEVRSGKKVRYEGKEAESAGNK